LKKKKKKKKKIPEASTVFVPGWHRKWTDG
jgi:hypothetical protein